MIAKIKGEPWMFRNDETGEYFLRIQQHESGKEGEERAWIDTMLLAGGTRQEAIALRKRIKADIKAGRFFLKNYEAQPIPTLDDLVKEISCHMVAAKRHPHTVYEFEKFCKKWQGYVGHVPVDQIQYNECATWWRDAQQDMSPAMANKSLMRLRQVIEYGIRIGAREKGNPAKALYKAKMPVVKDKPRLSLKAFHEILHYVRLADQRVIDAGQRPYMGHASYLLCMAALAARGGEVCNLQWEDIDKEFRTATLWDTKTAPSLIRQISPRLIEELEQHHEKTKRYSTPQMASSPYIFPVMDGGKGNATRPRNVWNEAVSKAGYIYGQKNRGWTPHDVRRLGIELLYEAGGKQRDVMQYVGHHVAAVHAGYLQRDSERLSLLANKTADRLFAEKTGEETP